MKRKGIIFILSSPSGGGKTTLLRLVLEKVAGLADSVSYTSRPKRPGERNGIDYHFLEEKDFRTRIGKGFFAEWASVHGHYYGTSREDLSAILERGLDAVMDIDVQGAASLRESFPDCVTLFILPPTMAELEARLRRRGTEDDESIRQRLETATREMEALGRYDYLVINRDLLESQAQIEAIIVAERQKAARHDAGEVLLEIAGGRPVAEERD